MAFVKFTDTGKSFAPKLSINARGYFNFSDGAKIRYGIDRYTHVILYHDAENKKIGIEMTNDETQVGAIKLRVRSTGGAAIAAKSFIDFFNLQFNKTTVFDLKPGDSEGWLVVDLSAGRERNNQEDAPEPEEDGSDLV